jgi:hypothetical protein
MIAGGTFGLGDFTGDVELYDPAADSWRPTAALPRKVGAHTATELPSGKVLVTGTVADMTEVDHPWVREYCHGPPERAALA